MHEIAFWVGHQQLRIGQSRQDEIPTHFLFLSMELCPIGIDMNKHTHTVRNDPTLNISSLGTFSS